jgi:hypothetical protein
MNRTLAARLKSREQDVTVNGHVFTVRRPKPAEMVQDMTHMDLIRRFVVGWNLTNADLVPGGTPDPEPFDAALFADFVDDDETLWMPLSEAISGLWKARVEAKGAAEKN